MVIRNSPNQPCACGSGKKQKKCHPEGAPVQGCQTQPPKRKESGKGASLVALSLMMVMGMNRD